MSQTLLVMGATMCHSLAALLPPAHSINMIIEDVITEMDRLAHLAPSLELSVQILNDAEDRRRQFLGDGAYQR